MFVGRPIANIVNLEFYQVPLVGLLQDAGLEIGIENLGKDGENIEAHEVIIAD